MFREREASSFLALSEPWSWPEFGLRGAVAVARCTQLAVLAFRGVSRPSRGAGFIGPARRAAPLNVDPRVCADSKAPARPATGKEADAQNKFLGITVARGLIFCATANPQGGLVIRKAS